MYNRGKKNAEFIIPIIVHIMKTYVMYTILILKEKKFIITQQLNNTIVQWFKFVFSVVNSYWTMLYRYKYYKNWNIKKMTVSI